MALDRLCSSQISSATRNLCPIATASYTHRLTSILTYRTRGVSANPQAHRFGSRTTTAMSRLCTTPEAHPKRLRFPFQRLEIRWEHQVRRPDSSSTSMEAPPVDSKFPALTEMGIQ